MLCAGQFPEMGIAAFANSSSPVRLSKSTSMPRPRKAGWRHKRTRRPAAFRRAAPEGPQQSGGPEAEQGLRQAEAGLEGSDATPRAGRDNNLIARRAMALAGIAGHASG